MHRPGEWRTNVSLGGKAEPCRLDPEAERLALAAARAIGAEMAGVDLIADLDLGPAGRAGGQRRAGLACPGTSDRNRRCGGDPRRLEGDGPVISRRS